MPQNIYDDYSHLSINRYGIAAACALHVYEFYRIKWYSEILCVPREDKVALPMIFQ